MSKAIVKGDKRTIRGWVMYDWANSVYNLVISSAIFPIFYDTQTTNYFKSQYFSSLRYEKAIEQDLPAGVQVTVNYLGMEISNSALMSFVLSAAFLVVAFLSPFLSGIADYLGNKKRFLQFFCYLGAIACISLYWFNPANIFIGTLSLFLASIGFWNSLVFYNAYLPEIAEPKDHDKISARGFSMGYFGSMLLLIICLGVILGIGKEYTRVSFVLVGIWWVGFAQFTYRVLPNTKSTKEKEKGYLWKGFRELRKVFVEFRQTNRLKKYLTAFFFFNTGVQTVMLMATYFAKKVIFQGPYEKQGEVGLILAILLIQILGAAGAFMMSRISGRIGNIKTLGISIAIWIGICAAAFIIVTPTAFYVLAASVGLVMGGIQAMARSTYSKFLPETDDHASYFSFYDATEKVGIVMGTLFFGIMEVMYNDMRFSVVSVAFFFVVGLLMLLRIPKNETIRSKA